MVKDDSQYTAIEFDVDKSLFVTAPPGYGKTHVLSERVKYIISNGHVRPPQKILALTFSNSAANEMKDRIKGKISHVEKYVDIMNFHTLAYLILRNYGHYIGLNRNFTIINEANEYEFKIEFFKDKGCIEDEFDEFKWINSYNGWFSQKFLGNIEPERNPTHYDENLFNELKEKIETEFINNNQLNFDYLLFRCLELLRAFPIIKDIIFSKYKFVLADEFQDTNYIQYLLFKEITIDSKKNKKAVFVVGDKKQAIMRFQGANPENIKRLIKDFACIEHNLKENHRTSADKIKDITDRLRDSKESASSKFKMYMAIETNKSSNTIVRINSCLIEKVNQLVENGSELHDICILFPQETISQLQNLKIKLKREKINFISITDYNFKSINKKYSDLFKTVETLINQNYNGKSVNEIIESTIKKYYPENNNNLILNTVKNFSNKFDTREYSSLETWKRLQEFYNHLQMDIDWSKLIRTKAKNKIFLSTIHSAKGLEFKFIFLIGIVNYQLPHHTTCAPKEQCNHSNNSKKINLSDAKDLFYVAISRSIEDIFFFFSKNEINSQQRLVNRKISCVFEDIYDLLRFIDIDRNKEYAYDDRKIKRIFCG